MNGTVFLRELRSGLIHGAACLVPAIGIVLVAGWLRHSDNFVAISAASLAVLVWIIIFASGARTFSLEDRQDQWLFWYSLPVSRDALWLSMVGGRMIASLLSLGLLLIVLFLSGLPDLALPQGLQAGRGWLPLSALALSSYATIFASGYCVSLVIRRTLLIHVTGLVLLWILLFSMARYVQLGQGLAGPAGFDLFFLAALFFFLAAVFSLLSWLFFRRGELHIWKRRAVNLGALVLALASTLWLIRMITRPPLVDLVAGPWIQPLSSYSEARIDVSGTGRLVSVGGQYLAVVESLENRLGYSRISLIETATGRLVGQRRWNDLEWVSWGGREQVLRIVSFDWDPFLMRYTGTVMHRVTPEGRILSQSRFQLPPDLITLQGGSDLLIESVASGTRVVLLAEPERARVLMELPGVLAWSTQPLRRQGVFVFLKDSRINQPWDIWHIAGGTVRKVQDKESIFRSPSQVRLQQRFGRPAFAQALQDPDLAHADQRLALSLPDSLALSVGTDGSAALYDGTLDREIPLPGCTRRASSPELIPHRNNLAFLVRLQCGDAASTSEEIQRRHFYYLPGFGRAKPLPALDRVMEKSPDPLAYLDEQTVIWREGETWKSLRQGQLRILWPE